MRDAMHLIIVYGGAHIVEYSIYYILIIIEVLLITMKFIKKDTRTYIIRTIAVSIRN